LDSLATSVALAVEDCESCPVIYNSSFSDGKADKDLAEKFCGAAVCIYT